jgi:hypothetical protein
MLFDKDVAQEKRHRARTSLGVAVDLVRLECGHGDENGLAVVAERRNDDV